MIGTHGVIVPMEESDANKRYALDTWARASIVRSVSVALGSLATALGAVLIAGC